jgi:hypothetical protein
MAPNGTVLGYSLGWDGESAAIPSTGSTVLLPVTGRYSIYASGLLEAYGPFQLTLEYGDSESFESRPDVPGLITDCPFQTNGELGDGSTDAGRRGDLYLTNSYLFRGYAGQKIEIAVTDSSFDSYVYLVSPSGSLTAQNDDNPSGAGSLVTQTLNEGGEWRIEVTSFSPFIRGNYKMEVKGCSPRAR